MIRFPRNHLADETLARISVAAKRVRTRRDAVELQPDDEELVALPASLMPTTPPAIAKPAAGAAELEAPIADDTATPPLEESGLDPGLVLAGADSFDAMLKT